MNANGKLTLKQLARYRRRFPHPHRDRTPRVHWLIALAIGIAAVLAGHAAGRAAAAKFARTEAAERQATP